MSDAAPSVAGRELRADCSRCFALCCVALNFVASADFAIDKPAGVPCLHLADDDSCGIHGELRERGFRGCTVYDCFGAGQHVSGGTFAGVSWRRDPATARAMFSTFGVMRQLHEMLWYLTDAARADAALEGVDPGAAEPGDAGADAAGVAELARRIRTLSDGSAAELAALEVDALWADVDRLLSRVSLRVRAAALAASGAAPHPLARRGVDLIGATLAGADFTGAVLRGAYLIAADLRGARFDGADLIGADLRDADVRGADLSAGLYLTGPQLAAARGDAGTGLPPGIDRPMRWER